MSANIHNLKDINNKESLNEINLFIKSLENLNDKKQIAAFLIEKLTMLFSPSFSSFVEKENGVLKVIFQSGNSSSIKETFNEKMSNAIFNWVIEQNKITSLKAGEDGCFLFLPLVDEVLNKRFEHGMLVLLLSDQRYKINKELTTIMNIMGKLTNHALTKIINLGNDKQYVDLREKLEFELKQTSELQKIISGTETNKKIAFSILGGEECGYSGNVWWIGEAGPDMTLVFIGQILCKGSPSAMLSGFLLGELNGLKSKADISLKPCEVLKHLNQQFNPVFKSTGITANAWYGVFNVEAKKIRFSNANHPTPFVIGPEQQVSNLISNTNNVGMALGININSEYAESVSNISSGSKLIICTKELLESTAKVGNRYDPMWFPQVLETIGSLSVSEMQSSLSSILSEASSGTGQNTSRLALLLEFPS